MSAKPTNCLCSLSQMNKPPPTNLEMYYYFRFVVNNAGWKQSRIQLPLHLHLRSLVHIYVCTYIASRLMLTISHLMRANWKYCQSQRLPNRASRSGDGLQDERCGFWVVGKPIPAYGAMFGNLCTLEQQLQQHQNKITGHTWGSQWLKGKPGMGSYSEIDRSVND